MVSLNNYLCSLLPLFAQLSSEPLIKRLGPERKVAVVMALLALTLIGIALVGCIMIGGHWVRKLARSYPERKAIAPTKSEAWRTVLADSLPSEAKDGKSGETMIADHATDETRAD